MSVVSGVITLKFNNYTTNLVVLINNIKMSQHCSRLYCINSYIFGKKSLLTMGQTNNFTKTMHVSPMQRFPVAAALKLPNNVIDINASEMSKFGPTRERDLSGPVINYHFMKTGDNLSQIDITVQSDPYASKYDCQGAVSLSSSMQSNVPSPFSGNHTHLGMPGSQWGQGYKYLSDHLHNSHYLTLRNSYRNKEASKEE